MGRGQAGGKGRRGSGSWLVRRLQLLKLISVTSSGGRESRGEGGIEGEREGEGSERWKDVGWERGRARGGLVGEGGRGFTLRPQGEGEERGTGKSRRDDRREGGKGGPAFPKGTAKHPHPTTAPSTTAQRTHTHTHKQTGTPSLPTTHCSYLSERLPGVGGVVPSSACMLLAAALRVE